jgi:MFS family permease
MPSLLRNVAALIAAIAILQLAGGLLGVRLPLAFTAEGHSRTELGLVAAAYSAGFMFGAMIATTLLSRVGHIVCTQRAPPCSRLRLWRCTSRAMFGPGASHAWRRGLWWR